MLSKWKSLPSRITHVFFRDDLLFNNKSILPEIIRYQTAAANIPVSQTRHFIFRWDDQVDFLYYYKHFLRTTLGSIFHLDKKSTVSNSFTSVTTEFSKKSSQFLLVLAGPYMVLCSVFTRVGSVKIKQVLSLAASAITEGKNNLTDKSHFSFSDFYLSKGCWVWGFF